MYIVFVFFIHLNANSIFVWCEIMHRVTCKSQSLYNKMSSELFECFIRKFQSTTHSLRNKKEEWIKEKNHKVEPKGQRKRRRLLHTWKRQATFKTTYWRLMLSSLVTSSCSFFKSKVSRISLILLRLMQYMYMIKGKTTS